MGLGRCRRRGESWSVFLSSEESVGDEVEGFCGAHALAFVVNDDGAGVVSLVADLDLLVAEIDGRFVALVLEAEGISFFTFRSASAKKSSSFASEGGRKRMRLRSRPKRSMAFMPRPECSTALYSFSAQAVNCLLSRASEQRSSCQNRSWSRTRLRNSSFFPFSAA